MLNINEKRKIAEKAYHIITKNEGKYNSVCANDNGGLSIGIMQWHENRALFLVRKILSLESNSQRNKYLGINIINEINTVKDWVCRKLTDEEAKIISDIISTPVGKKCQDETAINDILVYIDKGIKYGLSNENALIYFADGVNQYGVNSTLWKNICNRALQKGGTLEAMYNATKENTDKYLKRRKTVYDTLQKDEPNNTPVEPYIIKEIQSWCNDILGSVNEELLKIDGEYGPKTKKGIIKCFQISINKYSKKNITVDGVFNSFTKQSCPIVSVRKNNGTDFAFILKSMLYINNYNPNGLNNTIDFETEIVIRTFQKNSNLTVDGEAGVNTFTKLFA